MVESFSDGFVRDHYSWHQAQVAASQSAVAISIGGSRATNGQSLVTDHVMPYDGSVTDIAAAVSTAAGAGTCSVSVRINGTVVAAATLTINTAARASVTFKGQTVARFKAGQYLTVEITTNGAWNGTTSDLGVDVGVLFENFQP